MYFPWRECVKSAFTVRKNNTGSWLLFPCFYYLICFLFYSYLSQAYLQYMKFARRAEGIKSTREVFKKAREDVRTKFHIYVGAALMEYYCTKNKDIAFRIFELGLKKCPDNADYIMAYVDYLSHLNGKQIICLSLGVVTVGLIIWFPCGLNPLFA